MYVRNLKEQEGLKMAEFATNGKGNLGVTLGAVGTGLGVLGNGLLGNGLFNGWGAYGRRGYCNESDEFVTRYDAGKDARIATLEQQVALGQAEKYTDQKIIDVYSKLEGRIMSLERQVCDNATSQGVINATIGSSVSVLQNQVAQIMSLTKLVVPNTSVCPGWGNVTITPAAATT